MYARFKVRASRCKVRGARLRVLEYSMSVFYIGLVVSARLRVLMHHRHCSRAMVVERRYDP
jgi:hypothetical protein